MASVSPRDQLDPRQILDMNYAFAQTAMLVAAIRVSLFTHLAQEGSATPTVLAARAGTQVEPTERLLQGLRAFGLVEQEADSYRLTPIAEQFLVEGKPRYLGGDTLAMIDYLPAWFELDQTLRTNTPYRDLGDASTGEAFFAPRVRDLFPLVYPIAARTATELPLTTQTSSSFQLLDVGAGSAPWSVAFAQRYPTAYVTALDLPKVVSEGKQQVAELGLSDRYTWLAGDMETVELPSSTYDLIILAHVTRFISDERVKRILEKLVHSLRAGGTLIIADVFFAADHKGPQAAITLNLSMLVNTAGGRIRTCEELISRLRDLEVHDVQRFHAAGPFPVVVARKEEDH